MPPYFSQADHQALHIAAAAPSDTQAVYAKLLELHHTLHRRMRDRAWDLHPHWDKARLIASSSVSCQPGSEIEGFVLSYSRSREQAALVERLMGRDYAHAAANAEVARHPALELRVTPDAFAIEMIISPSAWWDQRNLIGKLSIDRHRAAFRTLLQRMDADFRFGFFEGCHLNDMHATGRQLLRGKVLDEWMGTFADGQDYLRIGIWYTPEEDSINAENILAESLRRLEQLYSLYSFIAWTGNNNYQSFYPRNGTVGSGRDQGYN